jgi:hypothetical protein
MSTPPKDENKQTPPPPPPPPPPKGVLGGTIAIIVVACIFILGFFGYLFYKNWYEDNELSGDQNLRTVGNIGKALPSMQAREQALISRYAREISDR